MSEKKLKIPTKFRTEMSESRMMKNISMMQLSEILGISRFKLSRIENGDTNTSPESVLMNIADALEMPYSSFRDFETVKRSYRMSKVLVEKLRVIQNEYKLNESEALRFCLEQFFANTDLLNARYDIKEIFDDSLTEYLSPILSTMSNDLETLHNSLNTVCESYDLDPARIVQEEKDKMYKRKHLEKYND